MSKRPEPVMACAECGPVIREPVLTCPLCGAPVWQWVDLAAMLDYYAWAHPQFADAANELRILRDTIERERGAHAGAKRRRQELKAARIAETIRGPRIQTRSDVEALTDEEWLIAIRWVNQLYPKDRHQLSISDETKALVAQKFAQPQEAPSA